MFDSSFNSMYTFPSFYQIDPTFSLKLSWDKRSTVSSNSLNGLFPNSVSSSKFDQISNTTDLTPIIETIHILILKRKRYTVQGFLAKLLSWKNESTLSMFEKHCWKIPLKSAFKMLTFHSFYTQSRGNNG